MQPITAPIRPHATIPLLTWLIQDSPDLTIGAGIELINRNLDVLEDFSDDLQDGTVTRESFATLHGHCSLAISRELAWGQAIVRPYVTLSSSDTKVRFNMGAYFTNAPMTIVGSNPRLFEVEGYDLLHALHTPTGEAYAVAAGESYIAKIEEVLTAQGFTKFFIDPSRADATLPSAKVWPLDEQTSWLTVVNDLLGSIGYQGIWSDWDGVLQCRPYINPSERQPEFVYVVDEFQSMFSRERAVVKDYFFVPNRWVAIRNNNVDGPTPVEGDGIYTYVNLYTGETSVEARAGLVTTRILFIDAADQEALIARAQQSINADIELSTKVELEVSPNPLHWHFDILEVHDPELGPPLKAMCTAWTFGFKARMMQQRWSVV